MRNFKLALIIIVITSIACSKKDNNKNLIQSFYPHDNYKEKTDWERDGLRGKVKKIVMGDEIIEYNQYGFRTKATNQVLWCGFGNVEMGSYIYEYDSFGRLKRSICYNTTRDGGAANPLDDYRNGKIKGWHFARDYRGEEYAYSLGDTVIINYNYNKTGDSLFFVVNEGKDTIWHPKNQWYITRYEEIYYPSLGGLKFDNKGRVSVLIAIPHSAEMDLYYYYNDKDQLIKDCWVNSKNGETENITSYKYDNNGNIIKEITEGTRKIDSKYIYDKHGNWIKKTEFISEKNLSNEQYDNSIDTKTRIIEYYQ